MAAKKKKPSSRQTVQSASKVVRGRAAQLAAQEAAATGTRQKKRK